MRLAPSPLAAYERGEGLTVFQPPHRSAHRLAPHEVEYVFRGVCIVGVQHDLTGHARHARKPQTSIERSSPKALLSRVHATMTAMCLSNRRPRWRRNHVRPIA